MELGLCAAFPALDPFRLGRESFYEVVMLVQQMARHNMRRKEAGDTEQDGETITVRNRDGSVTVMRRSRDDNVW